MIEFKSGKLTDEELGNAIYDVLHEAQLALENGKVGAKGIALKLMKDAAALYSKATGGEVFVGVKDGRDK